MRQYLSYAGFSVLVSGAIFGQTTVAPPAFEVASVKRDISGENGGRIRQLRGAFTATNSTLQALLRYAYGVMDYQIQGPGWMAAERYDIEAKTGGEADDKKIHPMLQNLLADRFGLKVRREIRQLPVYSLMVAKNGPKLHESKPADSTSMTSSNHSIMANKVTLQILARVLSGQMDRPVLDSTGLQGTFDVTLEWTPDTAVVDGVPAGPSIFAALQEQLGLRLESQTGPVEVIIVDHAEKIPTEN